VLVLEWQLDRLKREGLLQDVDSTSGTISVHDLYIEFAELEVQGKLDESTDLEDRRCVQIRNGDQLTGLDRTPSGGCWQKLDRLGIYQDHWEFRSPAKQMEILEGIEWQYCSNVCDIGAPKIALATGDIELEGPEVLEKPGCTQHSGS
jgi:hypothetical protein